MDIGGHPNIPLGPLPLFLSLFSVFLIIAQFTIFSSFSGPELLEKHGSSIDFSHPKFLVLR